LNCELIWKISKLKCEMIWKTWEKGKSNSNKIGQYGRKPS